MKGRITMMINGVNNRSSVTAVRSKASNSTKQDSFGDVLKSSAKDTFKISSASNTTETGRSSGVAYTQAKLNSISAEIEKTDYSGMTKAEIYADIEGKYAKAFDDFYATLAMSACKEHEMIHDQFVNNVHNYVGYLKGTVREARGYSGMTFDEIETAIKEKYTGKTDFISQLNLFGELFSSGVLSDKYGTTESCYMASRLGTSVECGGNRTISKSEWFSRIEEMGVSSPFTLLLNAPYLSLAEKEFFKSIVDDILFGNE